MSTQLQAIGNFSPAELETIKHTLAKDATNEQFQLFIRTAAASGLNPFLNHLYCIVYGGKMSIQISVEGIVYLAKKVEGYAGIDTQLVHENDEFEANIDQDGTWVITRHQIKFPRGKVIAGYSIAYRDGFKPFTVFMEVDEVQHHLTGTNAGNWKKYFNDFFKKTMTKRAAKGQYGIDISEDDAPEGSAGASIPSYDPTARKDITHEATHSEPEVTQEPPQQPAQTEEDKIKKARAEMKLKFAKLGITEKDAKAQFLADHGKFKDPASPTVGELTAVLRKMDLMIEQQSAQEDPLLGDPLV